MWQRTFRVGVLAAVLLSLGGCISSQTSSEEDGEDAGGGGNAGGPALVDDYKVLAYNDLGMHCADLDYSTFTILPPYNVVRAQVIQRGATPRLLDDSTVAVRYQAVADATGSITSTSQNGTVHKSNFWDSNPVTGNPYVQDLFGLSPAPDEGLLHGQAMPGVAAPYAANDAQPFKVYDAVKRWFAAEGVPILPVDDYGQDKPYPLMRVSAVEQGSNRPLASLDVVLPVSAEANCQNCHAIGEVGADPARRPDVDFVFADTIHDANNVLQAAKLNILRLHDKLHGTTLEAQKPVLCASCHYSAALDLAGQGPGPAQQGHAPMSVAMHRHHGELVNPATGAKVFPTGGSMEQTCYQCHPGKTTKCLRGAMGGAGMTCQSCHGGMLAVGGKFPLAAGGSLDGSNDGHARRPWLDTPRCQSCHTGDAVNHLGSSLRYLEAFATDDPAASPRLAVNQRFAENDHTQYRNSRGHGGVACSACHGSTHAIWPVALASANDNVAAKQLQGHAGTVTECTTCHSSLPLTTRGPHGMHNVNDRRWNLEHEEFYERNPAECRACHGTNLEGTPLSRTAADRTLARDDDGGRSIFLAKGTPVSCTLCHSRP